MKTLKRFAFIALALSLATLALTSCEKSEPVPTLKITYYLAGNQLGASPAIYKNDQLYFSLDQNSTVAGMTIVNDVVYNCGQDANGKPVIWEDGDIYDNQLESKITVFEDMKARNTDVFSCGYLTTGGSTYGVVLKNGQSFFTSVIKGKCTNIDFGVSGDVYTVFQNDEGVYLIRLNGLTADPIETTTVATNAANKFYATGLYVGYNDIVISLNRSAYITANEESLFPCCWLSRSGLFSLTNMTRGKAWDVTLYGGRFYVGGELCGKDMGRTNDFAAQWVNGTVVQDFSYGCTGDSSVVLLDSDGYYLYEAVWHEGGIQLCYNGALACNVNCPSIFVPECWVVRTQVIK